MAVLYGAVIGGCNGSRDLCDSYIIISVCMEKRGKIISSDSTDAIYIVTYVEWICSVGVVSTMLSKNLINSSP